MFKITGSVKKIEVVTAEKAKEIIKEAEEIVKTAEEAIKEDVKEVTTKHKKGKKQAK